MGGGRSLQRERRELVAGGVVGAVRDDGRGRGSHGMPNPRVDGRPKQITGGMTTARSRRSWKRMQSRFQLQKDKTSPAPTTQGGTTHCGFFAPALLGSKDF